MNGATFGNNSASSETESHSFSKSTVKPWKFAELHFVTRKGKLFFTLVLKRLTVTSPGKEQG